MSKLSGGKELSTLNRTNPSLGSLLSKMIDAHNHTAAQIGVDPVGQSVAPPAPNAVNVLVTGEMAHVRILDNNPTNRARNYFTEVYSDPQYTQLVHAQDHGTSRDATIPLPTNDADGKMHAFYMQSYSQTIGSPPSPPVAFPTYVTMDGTTSGNMPQSAGTGTANTQGTQIAQGFGSFPTRKATGVKRQV